MSGHLNDADRATRHPLIRATYHRYRDMDTQIMDPLFLIGDGDCGAAYRQTIRALWEAVKAAVEGEE